ncbi:hypothetical protein GQ457_15G025760 [Hibiscus cannabinus]
MRAAQQQMWKQQAMSQSLIEITSRASSPHGLCKGFSSQITKISMSNSATNSDLIAQPAFFRICNAVFTAHELIGTFSRPENGPANTTPPGALSSSQFHTAPFIPSTEQGSSNSHPSRFGDFTGGYGGILLSEKEQVRVIFAAPSLFPGLFSAELEAILVALQIFVAVEAFGGRELVVESGSRVVVNWLNYPLQRPGHRWKILADIDTLVRPLNLVSFAAVCLTGRESAAWLARDGALSRKLRRVFNEARNRVLIIY